MNNKDFASIAGLLVSYFLVFLAIVEPSWFVSISLAVNQVFVSINQNIGIFIDLPTFMIVLGGSFGAVIANFKFMILQKFLVWRFKLF